MRKNQQHNRIDEIEQYYNPIKYMDKATRGLFWVIAALSLFMPYTASILGGVGHDILKSFFIILTLVQFMLSQTSRFYLVPKAERMRRKHLLSDAFGTHLTHDRTSLYYNNNYTPSIERLGANTMENVLFSKEIAARMLFFKRWTVGLYLLIWAFAFTLRYDNLELLTWITQLVFSGEIIAGWLTLESLKIRHERTFEQLHSHFLHGVGSDEPRAIADVLDAFVAYESAKSSAGILLSSKIFNKINPELSKKWDQITEDLGMRKTSE